VSGGALFAGAGAAEAPDFGSGAGVGSGTFSANTAVDAKPPKINAPRMTARSAVGQSLTAP
jgi:hypothetical protein